ncbi:phage tail tube protein [Tahibacter soli]|uniref:Phage tail tube protein n=1 Tax=Tahibacter soli TaxID=2983605 RepID=A0A9X3YMG7_9GAMM|nr:phage tail tube protein [Tahibacter soli]MDC8013970.1 phage tail tube protein [Tahibacter soli]
MSGEIRTQGTQVYIYDKTATPSADVKQIPNVVDIGEFGPQADDIDVTNFDSAAKEYLTGLADNGELTLQLNLDPASPAHRLLDANAGKGERFKFAVCLSDGTAAPTLVSTVFTAPTGRTSYLFEASVKAFRRAIKTNDANRVNCVLRISGAIATTWKA